VLFCKNKIFGSQSFNSISVMPLVYQQNINDTTKLGVWHIAEEKDFFLQQVPLQRQITHPHKQLQHLAGRYLLKELYPDFPYELIRIADTRKPFLENEAYHFSISHCGDYAAVMVSSTQRVGVDVELVTQKVANVKHKFLSTQEQEMIEAIESTSINLVHASLLTAAWGIKESLFKWYGDGQVDFKEHLHIDKIIMTDNSGIAHCTLLKNTPVKLQVHFLFFNNNCISWVLS
jgi:phosphopantetheinyl transferase